MTFYTALDDDLLIEFYKYKHSEQYSRPTIEALYRLYKPPHITNIAQLQRTNIQDASLMAALAQSSSSWAQSDLENLSKETVFKLILGTGSSIFPHVNVNSDDIESNFTSTFHQGANRDKVKSHIKAMLNDATNVFIFDKYFKVNWARTKKFFKEIVPQKNITFFYPRTYFDQQMITEARQIYQWNFKIDVSHAAYNNSHDRYLIIDDKIEIILTSGFENLCDTTTDLSYVVREI